MLQAWAQIKFGLSLNLIDGLRVIKEISRLAILTKTHEGCIFAKHGFFVKYVHSFQCLNIMMKWELLSLYYARWSKITLQSALYQLVIGLKTTTVFHDEGFHVWWLFIQPVTQNMNLSLKIHWLTNMITIIKSIHAYSIQQVIPSDGV